MRALIQRVTRAQVVIDGEVVGAIGRGLCVLIGVTHDDDRAMAARIARKVWELRLFPTPAGPPDNGGGMEVSVGETTGEVLVVSQFTLYGETRKGRRPSWIAAARPEVAEPLVDAVVDELRMLGATVATGQFGAAMQVELVNDGPVTVLVEL
jgi:D-tyrosyl-tRNA(Tyr) deacylase